jgi:hypothetical protein
MRALRGLHRLATVTRMKRRRQQPEPDPADPFLDALAAGRDDGGEAPEAPAPAGGSESAAEQRARVAEGALRQLRTDSERRLQAAREAIQQERELRLAAEAEVARLRRGPATHGGLHEVSQPPVFSRDEEDGAATLPPAAAGGAPAWPSPWLGDQSKS